MKIKRLFALTIALCMLFTVTVFADTTISNLFAGASLEEMKLSEIINGNSGTITTNNGTAYSPVRH